MTIKDSIGPRLRSEPRQTTYSAATLAGVCLGMLAVAFMPHQAAAQDGSASLAISATDRPLRADFRLERASSNARHVADWAVHSGDNRGLPFVIVDKTDAKVFVFHSDGRLRGAAPALLGLAIGDDSVPGIGERELSTIRPAERTTPAGRFVASLGENFKGQDILWVDYDSALSMHRVITNIPKDRRAQRLATATPRDNRISYGCINVPVTFYETVVSAAFAGSDGIVYVLPEVRTAREVFASYDVTEPALLQAKNEPEPRRASPSAAAR